VTGFDAVLPVVSGSFQAIENTVCYVLTKFSNRMHNVEQSQAASAFAVLESDIGSARLAIDRSEVDIGPLDAIEVKRPNVDCADRG
jgi:hypothetical protein